MTTNGATLSAPLGLLAELTHRCPLGCPYCSNPLALDKRPPQAQRDADFALSFVKGNARTPEQQQAVLAALEFKCSVLWSTLGALYYAYVSPGHVPPGAFVPEGQ